MNHVAALKSATVEVAVCALRVEPGQAMQRLIPAGEFSAPRGAMSGTGPWVLTEDAGKKVIALAAARSTDIVIDYEHQTLLADQNGKPAPASGWVEAGKLEWRDDGLYGPVSWTTAAAKGISDGEFRYLSPVFTYNKDSGEVLNLLHLALTNIPAIDSDATIAALAAARMSATHETEEDDSVKREELIKTLGLKADATDADINAELAALKQGRTELAALREGLEVEEDGNAVEAVAALKTKAADTKPDMNKYVPKEVYEESQQQLAALKSTGDEAQMDALIKEGLDDGRIAGKATAKYLRGQGLAALKAHLEDAPSIAALKGTQTQGKKPEADEDSELSAEALAVCKNMGISPEDYKKANAG